MNPDVLKHRIERWIDSKHSTSVLRHDVLDLASRAEFVDKLAAFVAEVFEEEYPALVNLSAYDDLTGEWLFWEALGDWEINDEGQIVLEFTIRPWDHDIQVSWVALNIGNQVKVLPLPTTRVARRDFIHVYIPMDWEVFE